MRTKLLLSALAGAGALVVWTVVINVMFGFNVRYTMQPLPNERELYEVLKRHVTEPGVYLCNPALTAEGRFPGNEPVFGVRTAGVGHEAAGAGMLFGLAQYLLLPLAGAWLLSGTSERFRARYADRVLFFAALGLIAAVAGDLSEYGIGGAPLSTALLLAARTAAGWTVTGLAVAAVMPHKH
ncbi:MAG: hypothetical protein F9K22_03840 [Bacteroidetes bacterium]|nr:MAG: hypothetical protein F9K22_03840 [Bacteroidota bacterium]